MLLSHILLHLSGGSLHSTVLIPLTIILSTFILEDPTTVLVGVLAAENILSVPLAIVSLYIGIIVGDLGLYGLGSLARRHPRFASYMNHNLVAPLHVWLETHYVLTIFSVRFVPGLRLPTYTASGFFRSSFPIFLLTIVGATVIWTTLLFSASYWFGTLTNQWFGWIRWSIALFVLVILFLVGRHNLRSYRTRKSANEQTEY
jgi:membrane protein DedA with SNARE-associated domain